MDVLKLFPALILDFLAKVIPGLILIAAFKVQDLPPPALIMEVLGVGQTVLSEWGGWYPLVVTIVKAYTVGIFVALVANAIDGMLAKKRWYDYAKKNEPEFSFDGVSPPGLAKALQSNRSFQVYIEHCRTYLYTQNSASSALLEKYRTAFRFFIALTIACIALPFGPYNSSWSYLLIALPCGAIAVHLSKRYLEKTIEYFLFAKTSLPADAAGPPKKPNAQQDA